MSGGRWARGVDDPDPIALKEEGGDKFWVHSTSYLEKPLTTRVGVAGHVTSRKE